MSNGFLTFHLPGPNWLNIGRPLHCNSAKTTGCVFFFFKRWIMVDKKSIYRGIFRAEAFLKCLVLEVGTHDKLVSVKNISELFSKRRQLV